MEEVRDDLYAHKYAPMHGTVAVHVHPHEEHTPPPQHKKEFYFLNKAQHLQKKVHFVSVVP